MNQTSLGPTARRAAFLRFLWVLMWVGGTWGCTFAADVPREAQVLCGAPARCPVGWSCRADTGQCVAPGVVCLLYADEGSAQPAPDGSACADGICVQGLCKAPTCGDGIRSGDEACDDGNAVETDECRNDCTLARCGDGVVQAGVEACDDGNDIDEDECLSSCARNVCGDGVQNPAVEECDDGNDDDSDGCLTTCLLNRCGDGFVDARTEQCDDGNDDENDGCRNSCQLATCGDGVVQAGVEECDDGNQIDEDACLSNCQLNRCGDGYHNPASEGCDDGNDDNRDGCLTYCERNVCGDGFLDLTSENCDDGDLDPHNACKDDCTPNLCGDGVLFHGIEACDDGNTASGDGCRRDCGKVEVCGDGELDQGEECDDGNQNQLDLCRHCKAVQWQPEIIAGFGEGNAEPDAWELSAIALAVDRDGNVLVSNLHDNYIYRYDAQNQKVTRFAGTGTFADFGNGLRRPAHQVNTTGVVDIAIDGRGRLLLTDLDEAYVRQLDARTGEVTVVAGTGEQGFSGDGLPASMATLNLPESAISDGIGNVFIADTENSRIRRIDHRTGIIATIAGTGQAGFSGDGGDPLLAQLSWPGGLEMGPDGTLYFIDRRNNRIRRLVPDPNDRYRFVRIETVTGDGSDFDPSETGLDRGIAHHSLLSSLALSSDGHTLYFTSRESFVVFAVDLVAEDVTVLAGGLGEPGLVDDVPAAQARFGRLDKVAVDGPDRIYVTDVDNARLRVIERSHKGAPWQVRTVAGGDFANLDDSLFSYAPYLLQIIGAGYALGERPECANRLYEYDVYFTTPASHRVYRRDCGGAVRILGGTGIPGYAGDGGEARAARFAWPSSVMPDGDGVLYVADQGNHRIRRIFQNGVVETYAGAGTAGFSGDGGDAKEAEFHRPSEVAFDGAGHLLVIDSGNLRIRRIDQSSGQIETVVGTGNPGLSEDGPGPLSRDLLQPLHGTFLPASQLLPGASGGLFLFTERGAHRIRVWADLTVPGLPFPIEPSLFTLAGDGIEGYRDDEDGRRARFSYPRTITWFGGEDCDGPCLLVTDGYDRVRLLQLVPQPTNPNRPLAAQVSTLLGGAQPVHDGSFQTARLFGPTALVQLPGGPALFTERNTGRLRRLDFAGETVTTLAGLPAGLVGDDAPVPLALAGPLAEPADMVLDTGTTPHVLYIAEQAGHTLRRITLHDLGDPSTWTLQRYLGEDGVAGHRDGAADQALFDGPSGLAVDPAARVLFVAEAGNQTLRRVDLTTDEVTTVAGTPGQIGSFGDNAPAADALFFQPSGLALSAATSVSGARSLYIADTGNHRVRRIDGILGDAPTIHTVLGDGAAASSGEGGPARFFPINAPSGMALDDNGNLYATSSNAIRLLLAEDDGRSDAADAVASIYGSAPRNVFPEPITTCLRDLQLGPDGSTLYALDECLGVVLRLSEEDGSGR